MTDLNGPTTLRGSHVNNTEVFEPLSFAVAPEPPSAPLALEDDPVVGTSGFMPLTRTDDSYEWRMFMGGEIICLVVFTFHRLIFLLCAQNTGECERELIH